MPLRLVASPLVAGLMVLAIGCLQSAPRADRPGRSSDGMRVIGHDEIRATPARNAEDLLQRLRPQWLLPRVARGRAHPAQTTPTVYVNDVRQGGIDVLHLLPTERIVAIICLPAVEADRTFTGSHPGGAIVIRTRDASPR
jgi:hypothetical protein